MLIITNSFKQKELKPLRKYYNIRDIKKTVAKISSSGIYLSHLGYRYGSLIKLRMSHKIAGRLIVYVFVQKNWVIPLVLRLKKDKIIGQNLSSQNIKAKRLILNRIDQTMNDIKKDSYLKYN